MTAIFPLVSWLFSFIAFSRFNTSIRRSFILASVSFGVLVTVLTELLSAFRALNFFWVCGSWLALAAGSIFMALYLREKTPQKRSSIPPGRPSIFSIVAAVCLGGLLLAAAVTAWWAPPNNYDSMTYHMGRVAHWVQNQSVRHYPTHILRQLHLNPWAEFAITHFQILTGSDRLANFIQWFSFLGCIVSASLIAAEFKASSFGQLCAGLITATLPMAILQSSSTQNDLAVSFWLLCFVYFALRSRAEIKPLDLAAGGLSLGLAILTKATAYLYAFPFLLWWICLIVKNAPKRSAIGLLVIFLTVSAMNAGHWARNFDLYGSPLGAMKEDDADKYTNDSVNGKTFLSNILRNLALHTGLPDENWNNSVEKFVTSAHTFMDIDVNDRRTTMARFGIPRHPALEDVTGNPSHLFLIVLCALSGAVFFIRGKKINSANARHVFIYGLCVFLGFALFCLTLKWQPWHSRLHLPFFILSAPFSAVLLEKWRFRWAAQGFAVLLLINSHQSLLHNQTRPLLAKNSIFTVPRGNQYFSLKPELMASYKNTVKHLESLNLKNVGLFIFLNDWEYPLWALSRENGRQKINFRSVGVKNISSKLYHEAPDIDAVIVSTWAIKEMSAEDHRILDGYYFKYGAPRQFGSLIVFGKTK